MLTPSPSFPQKRETRDFEDFWIPALRFAAAGMTVLLAGGIFPQPARARRQVDGASSAVFKVAKFQ